MSKSAEIESQVIALAAAIFGVEAETLSRATRPDDVAAWDSVAHLTLAAAIEDARGVRLDEAALAEAETLGALIDLAAGAEAG